MSEYIERSEMYKFCKEQIEKETGAYSKGRNAGLKVAMSATMNNDAIRTVDVAPVVHGKWVYEEPNGANSFKGSYWCNQCHRPVTFRENYCPECGANMDL